MKLAKDTLMEDGKWSHKRILAFIFSIIAVTHAITMIARGAIPEGHGLLFGEILSFIGLLLGLSVINKHKALREKPPEELANEDEVAH